MRSPLISLDQPPNIEVVDLHTRQILDRFLEAGRARGWSPVTIDEYNHHLLLFFNAIGKTTFEEITPADLRKYSATIAPKKDRDFNISIASIKSLFKWAYKQDIAENNIGEKIDLRKIQERPIESYVWLVNGEIARLLAACKTFKQTLIVKFFIKTGVRVGRAKPVREFCGLTWDDFDFEQRTVRVHGKGSGVEGKIRYAHFDTELSDLLKEWRDKYRGKMPICRHPTTVAENVRKLARDAGIPKLANAEHPVHALKHTFCTNWVLSRRKAKLSEDLRGLSAQVGTKIATLEVYVHIAEQYMKSSYDETMKLQQQQNGGE